MTRISEVSQKKIWGFWLLVLLFSLTNILKNYWNPPETIWDESFYIPAAAKYIEGTFFMEPHPPLGKLLIAAGEVLTRPLTGQSSTFNLALVEESAGLTPREFNPFGYRFFPVLFAFFNTFLFAALLLHIFKSHLAALAIVPLYLFENSLVAHSRAAMIDSFLFFGVLLSVLAFLKLMTLNILREKRKFWLWTLAMALGLGIATLTKAFGWALILLWPLLYVFHTQPKTNQLRRYFQKAFVAQLSLYLFLFHLIWALHFGIAQTINPQGPNRGYYGASAELEEVLSGRREINPLKKFYWQLFEHTHYFWEYEKSVIALDFKKGDKVGSYPPMWPLGSRPVVYLQNEKPNGGELLLAATPNPVNWLLGFLGVLLIPGLLLSQSLGSSFFSKTEFRTLLSLYLLYLAFYLPLFFVRRILYLNHYFTPLLISFLIAAFLMNVIYQKSKDRLRPYLRASLGAIALSSVLSFHYFKPLTYFNELSCKEMNNRFFIRFWDMSHPACEHPAERVKTFFGTQLDNQ